jgi:hypothetical protein
MGLSFPVVVIPGVLCTILCFCDWTGGHGYGNQDFGHDCLYQKEKAAVLGDPVSGA